MPCVHTYPALLWRGTSAGLGHGTPASAPALAGDPVALGSPRLNSPTSTVSKLSSASYDSHFPSQISTSSDLFDPTLLGRDRDLLISLLQVQPPPPIVQYPE